MYLSFEGNIPNNYVIRLQKERLWRYIIYDEENKEKFVLWNIYFYCWNPFIYSNVVRNIGNKAKKNFIVKPHSVGVGFSSLRTFQRLSLDTWLVSATLSLWTEPKTDARQYPYIKNVSLNVGTKQSCHDFLTINKHEILSVRIGFEERLGYGSLLA